MITIYTKSYCPYCTLAKNLLSKLKVEFKEIDITNDPEIMQKLHEKSNMLTVPQIFVNDHCLGGYSDIEKLHNEGKLLEKINLAK